MSIEQEVNKSELDMTPLGRLDELKDELDEYTMDRVKQAIIDIQGITQGRKGLRPSAIKSRVSAINAWLDIAEDNGLIPESGQGARYDWEYDEKKNKYNIFVYMVEDDEDKWWKKEKGDEPPTPLL